MLTYNELMISNDASAIEDGIKYYASKYYTGESEITDDEFDNLISHLRSLSPESEILRTTGWGYDPMGVSGNKVQHSVDMGSIHRKPRSYEDIPGDFKGRVVRITPKLDGISMALYYKNGYLDKAVTRGNGKVGLDVTEKLKKATGVLNRISDEFTGVIRGECIMMNSDWERFSKLHPDAKDPRNSVSGIINADNSPYMPYVTFIPYKILAANKTFNLASEISPYLWDLGFIPINTKTAGLTRGCTEDLTEIYTTYCQIYPCDGLVLTKIPLSSTAGREIVYDEIAYKFNGETAVSTVRYISWNLTRTQRMVPTIIIDPIHISGATIQRVSGNNAKYLIDNQIGIDAEVKVMRSGEVIPLITEVIKPTTPHLPCYCPKCNMELSFQGVDLVCTNADCYGSKFNRVEHWISTIAKVDGLGLKLIDEFISSNDIESIGDLYDRSEYCYPGTPAADNLIDKMFMALNFDVDPIDALCALNIPRLGRSSAEKIVDAGLYEEFKSLQDLNNESGKIRSLVGPATYKSIINNRSVIENLKYLKIRMSETHKSDEVSKGEVVITGALSIKRSEFEKIVRDKGYTLAGVIKKTTKYLITNDPNGSSSKNKKATELGVPKVTEAEFMNM